MAYRHADDLLDEFARDWAATLCPDITYTLNCCWPGQREDLRQKLDEFLATAPTPPYSDLQLKRFAEKIGPRVTVVAERLLGGKPSLRVVEGGRSDVESKG